MDRFLPPLLPRLLRLPRRLGPVFAAALLAALAALPAQAGCYADYKAKREEPLRLHYGVAEVAPAACGDLAAARAELAPRLARAGWVLLTVLGAAPRVSEEQRARAAEHYLRY